MHVIFRVDASQSIGLGHLMRCLALAGYFSPKHHVTFLINKTTHPLYKALNHGHFKALIMPDLLTPKEEVYWLNENVELKSVDWLVLDGYQFSEAYRFALSSMLISKPCLFAIFDDNNDQGQLYANCIINGNEHASLLDYRYTASTAELCLGAQYRVIRQAFAAYQNIDNPITERHEITVIMGGSDTKNLTLSILQRLHVVLPQVVINVITGQAYPHLNVLTPFVQAHSRTLKHHHNCQNVEAIFARSRLAISAGGTTQYELQACCTPTILLMVANNQEIACNMASKQEMAHVLDFRQTANLVKLVTDVEQLWPDENRLIKMHNTMKAKAVLNGAENIINTFMKKLDSK